MVVANNQTDETKNAGKSTTISMTMVMQRYNAGHSTQWSTSRALLKATGCCHWLIACAVLPRRPPWSTNSNKTQKTLTNTQLLPSNYGIFRALVVCENFNPKTNPLLRSSMRQASCKYETPQLELKSSQTFLAIKRCQRTKTSTKLDKKMVPYMAS